MKYILMREGEIVGWYDDYGEALTTMVECMNKDDCHEFSIYELKVTS